MAEPCIVSRATNYVGKFIKYETLTWRDSVGKERFWEVAERSRDLPAVMMIPWFKPSDRLLLIRQYRPPADARVIEFPAGLMEPNETPEFSAKREMREETGYDCRIVNIAPATYNSPGLSSERDYNVFVEISDDAPSNPQPDDGEDIENIIVPRADIASFLAKEIAAGSRFNSRVLLYLQGMVAAQK